MHQHLVHLATRGEKGHYLEPHALKGVTSCIRLLRGAKIKAPKSDVADASWKDLMKEAAKYPELAEAIAAMGGET
jgi:hypothetical protein